METYTMHVKNERITIQVAEYIEDGWYIEIANGVITLYEIPLHGGQEQEIGTYKTIVEAIEASKKLT